MKRVLHASILALSVSSAFAGDPYRVYFGTGTSPEIGSRGIYVSKFDADTGALSIPELAVETLNPGFLSIHPSKKILLSVGEMEIEEERYGAVQSFKIDEATGSLRLISQVASIGTGPCHVNIDATGKVATVANYTSGSIASYQIAADGTLSAAATFIQHAGTSVDPYRQSEPHAHAVNFSPDNRFAFACDLGLDKVLIYRLDPATAKLTPNDPSFVKTPAGGGPRHLAFHPSGEFVFVNNEMAMTVTSFRYQAATGALSEIGTVSTLPDGVRVIPAYSTAETLAHPNGKFVYVSNRGYDTIAVFGVDSDTGKLTLRQNVPAEGAVPRNICLDPSGKWLIAAHQKSGTAAVFKVDTDTGELSFTGTKVPVPGSNCVRFVPIH